MFLLCNGYISTTIFEGFNHPILEAIYYNKVVFARPLAVHKEIFGDYIIYCKNVLDFIEKIRERINQGFLIPNQSLREKLLKKYKWKKSAHKLSEVIKDIIS